MTIVILSRSVAKAKNPCFVRLRPFACAQGDNHVSRRRLFQHPGPAGEVVGKPLRCSLYWCTCVHDIELLL